MTPRLVLLTGPAAGEVAGVFRSLVNGDALRYITGNGEGKQWDEVRDYWEAPRCIAGVPDAVAIEYGIREYPGGEAWLVGLVLPEESRCGYCQARHRWGQTNCTGCDRSAFWLSREQPARLAILAPDPPPLLVERVRAWGGEVWHCCLNPTPGNFEHGPKPCRIFVNPQGVWDNPMDEDTWPEAVRAALGEVAP